MNRAELEKRTLHLAVGVVHLVTRLQAAAGRDVIGNQILRSATSVGANYREANRAESRKDFIHKLAITEKEASETHYWLEVIRDAHLADDAFVSPLLDEAEQIVRILNSARRTMRERERDI